MTQYLKRDPGKMSFMQISSLSELRIPKPGEQIRFITTSKINMISFFDFLKSSGIEKCIEIIISNSSIDAKAIKDIEKMDKELYFDNLICQINQTEEGRKPEIIKKYMDLSSSKIDVKLKSVHAKVILIKHGENHLVLEGSGNISTNAEIEQYCFSNSKESYDFHKEWITKKEEKPDDNQRAFNSLIEACVNSVQQLFKPQESDIKKLNTMILIKFEESMGKNGN